MKVAQRAKMTYKGIKIDYDTYVSSYLNNSLGFDVQAVKDTIAKNFIRVSKIVL